MILPNTPSLISAGRVEKSGFTYVWAHGYMPCLINNDSGDLIVFDVSSNLPVILKGCIFDTINDPIVLSALSGVVVTDDYIHVARVRSHHTNWSLCMVWRCPSWRVGRVRWHVLQK